MLTWLMIVAMAWATSGESPQNVDPNARMEELMNVTEDIGQIQGEIRRFWMIEQPSHMTPIRVHGGLGP
jgi:hypothetical protein